MKNQQIINLETKITEIQIIINNYRKELTQYENTLLALAKQLSQIKNNQTKENMNNQTNKNNAVNSEINTK